MRMWRATLAAIAGIYGAAGVGLAAAGAHLAGGAIVTTAAHFLLFHAGAMVALTTAAALLARSTALHLACTCMALGVFLFSGDLALRGLAGVTPLRLAAPSGGIVLILSWVGVAVALPMAFYGSQDPRNGG